MIDNKELINDYELLENDLKEISQKEQLKININQNLEEALQELKNIETQLPKEQSKKLFEQCTQNALDAITSHFGLAAIVLDSQDGGNVSTTHNARKDIYANENDKQQYEKREKYCSKKYHNREYNKINNKLKKEIEEGRLYDYATGKMIKPKDNTQLDHVVSAKEIHEDRARILANADGVSLANTPQNLKKTDAKINNFKRDNSATKTLEKLEGQIQILTEKEIKNGKLSLKDQKNIERLLDMQCKIDNEKFIQEYDRQKKHIDNEIDKIYYTSLKPYKEALITGAKDSTKMIVYSALGMILRDFFKGLMIEIKKTFKEFGNESFSDIFKRFKDRIHYIWDDIKKKWENIFASSLEAGIQAFLSNLVVFAVNTIFTTLKRIVQVIRAGFTSLYNAIKIIINPPKDMPKEDIYFEAAKIFTAGIIASLTMLGSEAINKWLITIPGLNVLLSLPIPFTSETIGDAISLSISAAFGAIVSTIVIFYMDKWKNNSKIGNLRLQLVTQSGVILNCKIAQTWLMLDDAYIFLTHAINSIKEKNLMLQNNLTQELNTYKKMDEERKTKISNLKKKILNLKELYD